MSCRHSAGFEYRSQRRQVPRRAQKGYVLLFVTVALTVVALVAARLAFRIDGLRQQALTMQGYAQASLQAESAKARALYWLSTRPLGLASSGFLDEQPLALDGRLYTTDEGVRVRLQDERGLLSVNVPDRDVLLNVLGAAGATLQEAASMVDVLDDYVDTDNLKRLNGAEAPDYRAAGLPEPRNDWVLSTDELARMMVWQGKVALRAQVQPWLGVRRDKFFNPNTAPLALMRAMWPKVTAEQWALFDAFRRRAPFGDAAAATASTGIPFLGDNLLFHASNAVRLQVWAPGLPQALEYNLLLLPTGATAPWLIHEVRQSNRLAAPADATTSTEKFPVPSQAVAPSRSLAQPAP